MVINSRDYIKINGVSCGTVGLYCDTPSVPPFPKMRTSSYQTGSDEDYISSDDSYENVRYKIYLYTFDNNTDFDNTDIFSYFADARELELSRLNGYYYKVKALSVNCEQAHDGKRIRYALEFTLAPFKYKSDNPFIAVNSGDIVTNTGTRYSKPTLEISGSGETDFLFNGKVLKLYFGEVQQTVIVDCENCIVYKKDTKELLYNFSAGRFPVLPVGETKIAWYRPATVKIRKNERCY